MTTPYPGSAAWVRERMREQDAQMAAMTTRIVQEALDIVRAEAERQEWGTRVYQVPQEALEAAKAARERLWAIQDSPEMPCWPLYDFQTRRRD